MSDKPKVLFVDDEELVLKAVYRDFLDENYEIFTAMSGKEGLDLLHKTPCEVVVSDFRMPQMNGGEFLKLVSESWPDTVRIVLSGYADITSVISAINEGAIFKFVSKPWQGDELRETVAEAMSKYREMSQLRALAEQALGATEELFHEARNSSREVHERNMQLEDSVQFLEIYRAVFHSTAIPMIVFNLNGELQDANPQAISLLSSATGLDGTALIPEGLLDDVHQFLAKKPVESKVYSGHDGEHSIRATLSAIKNGSGALGAIAILESVS